MLKQVSRRYDGARGALALDAVDLRVAPGEFVVLVGPSGCGKSTTLRLVAGLDDPDGGTINIGGVDMAGIQPDKRDVAMVFQSYALYPHMTAREILDFPLRMRNVGKADRKRAVEEPADLLSLGPLLDRRPDQLSGGERQRVAMGRAIVRKPKVFLFDEPLANLDSALRAGIRLQIGLLVRKLGATALYVTHDHTEAMTLADRIVVMNKAKVEQEGTPKEIYTKPRSAFVGAFMGSPKMNLLEGTSDGETITCGSFRFPAPPGCPGAVTVGIRPEHVVLSDEGEPGTLLAVEPLGADTHFVVEASVTLRARMEGFSDKRPGERVHVRLDPVHLHLFNTADGRRVG